MIGDHVRKRRLDLGLLQREVASRIGVDKTTVFNWEAGAASPNLRAMPAVIQFLGHDPTEPGSTIGDRLRATRRGLGLSHVDLARRLGVDPTTVLDWERGRHRPSRHCPDRVAEFLTPTTRPRRSPSQHAPWGKDWEGKKGGRTHRV